MAKRVYDPIGALNGLFAPPHIAGDPQAEAAVGAWNAAHIPGSAQFAAPFAAGSPASMASGDGLFAPPYIAGNPSSTAAVEAYNAKRDAIAQQMLAQARARQQAAEQAASTSSGSSNKDNKIIGYDDAFQPVYASGSGPAPAPAPGPGPGQQLLGYDDYFQPVYG